MRDQKKRERDMDMGVMQGRGGLRKEGLSTGS